MEVHLSIKLADSVGAYFKGNKEGRQTTLDVKPPTFARLNELLRESYSVSYALIGGIVVAEANPRTELQPGSVVTLYVYG